MLAEDYWRKLRLKLQHRSATQASGSEYEENVRKVYIVCTHYIKHHCRYAVQNKWHLQRLMVINPFTKGFRLSNQVHVHVL